MGKMAFIYPGQGAQHIGMGKDAAESFTPAADIFKAADAALGFDLSGLVFGGDEEALKITENTQPALLATCMALSAALTGAGLWPDAAAGLSIGEYAAHVLSGTFAFADAIKIVRLRGRFMQEAVPLGLGGMAAVLGLDAGAVEACCAEAPARAGDASLVVEPANYNCLGQIVISGHVKAVEAACALCKEQGARRAVPLAVSAPFHCSLLRGAGEKLAAELAGIPLNPMKIPVVSNVTAEYTIDSTEAVGLLVRQVASPVRWEQSVREMIAQGVDRFVEIGPGKTLAGFITRIDAGVEVINVSDAATVENAIGRLA
ncbi:MAG: ACP S-malonyltransferase [Oscillospiraceae bacterium]|nr:ACP S-malonyltransferase [Oscillospiraceae bacterium]